jgi:chromosome partitioning protein
MKTLAVLSRKGGAGKTTVSLNLALAARQAGLKVMVADVDPLHSAAEILRRRAEADSILCATAAAKLFVVQQACRENGYDLLIIDTPTGPEPEIMRAANLSDLCLAVARPTSLDLAAVRESISLIRRSNGPGLVVLNQCPPRRSGAESALVEQAVERLRFAQILTANSKLRSRIAYQRALSHNCSVTEWEPSSEAAAEVLRLLAEISDHLMLPDAGSAPAPLIKSSLQQNPVHLMQAGLTRLAWQSEGG